MKLTFLGTGLMGRPMAERLIAAGHQVTVYNRTRERAEPLQALGAQLAATPASAIQNAECVILMLTNAAAIEQLLLNDESRAQLKDRAVIQMSTISPGESREFYQQVSAAGGDYLEAPVLGSINEAKNGKLIVMVGATIDQFHRRREILKCFGNEPLLIGATGQAAALKLALNHLIASLTSSFCLSLGYLQSSGVDVEIFMKILRESALYAPTFDKKLTRYLERDYSNPNFPVKHLTKDVKLFLDEAIAAKLNTAVLNGVYEQLMNTIDKGFADADYSAIFDTVYEKS